MSVCFRAMALGEWSIGGTMGERPKCAKEDVLALMDDERLRRLRSAADVGLLLYEDLDDYELPEGYDKKSMWRL